MSTTLFTVEQAAQRLNLHPKTVLRYIRDGQLPATRVGKSWRIAGAKLDAFAGIATSSATAAPGVRTTAIVDIPDLTPDEAQRLATMLHAAALAGDANTPPLHFETAYDPMARTIKLVLVGDLADVSKLLEMLEVQVRGRG